MQGKFTDLAYTIILVTIPAPWNFSTTFTMEMYRPYFHCNFTYHSTSMKFSTTFAMKIYIYCSHHNFAHNSSSMEFSNHISNRNSDLVSTINPLQLHLHGNIHPHLQWKLQRNEDLDVSTKEMVILSNAPAKEKKTLGFQTSHITHFNCNFSFVYIFKGNFIGNVCYAKF